MTDDRRKTSRRTALLAGTLIAMMLLPGTALAGDDAPEGDDSSATVKPQPVMVDAVSSTLPVLGAGVTVAVTLDETGHLAEVTIDGEAVEPEEGKRGVSFVITEGETEVRVRAHHGVVQTKVKTNDIENVTGPGAWSADVFGNGDVGIAYTVGLDGDDNPTITVNTVTAPTGVDYTILEPKTWTSEKGNFSFASTGVALEFEGRKARLHFTVKAYEKDGEVRVSLSATLAGRRFHRWHGWHHGHWNKDGSPDDAAARFDGSSEDGRGWSRRDHDDSSLRDASWDGRSRDGDRDGSRFGRKGDR